MSTRSHHRHLSRIIKRKKSFIDRAVLAIAIVEPLMTIPQIYQIWSTHNAQGVSLLSWLFYMLAAAVWLVYGIKIRDKPIILSSSLWVLTEGLVVLGVLFYK